MPPRFVVDRWGAGGLAWRRPANRGARRARQETDAADEEGDISDDVHEEPAGHLSESQIVEITMIAPLYNMVNRFTEALKLDLEPY